MNDKELRALIERMIAEVAGQAPTPQVKGSVYHPMEPQGVTRPSAGNIDPAAAIPDITQTDLRRQYLVESPRNGRAFLDLKQKTPARIGLGRAGARYKTATMLRFRADHAAAQDSVFSHVDDGFVEKHGFVSVQTLCQNKDEYLTRPDRGRRFDEANQAIIKKTLGQNPKVALVVGDGLSSAAIEANAADCLQAIQAGLKTYGLEAGQVLCVRRDTFEKKPLPLDGLAGAVKATLEDVHRNMFEIARAFRDEHTKVVHNMDELTAQVDGGYAKAMWCGDQACEDRIKELTGATSRNMPFDQTPVGDTCVCCGKKADKVMYFAKAY